MKNELNVDDMKVLVEVIRDVLIEKNEEDFKILGYDEIMLLKIKEKLNKMI